VDPARAGLSRPGKARVVFESLGASGHSDKVTGYFLPLLRPIRNRECSIDPPGEHCGEGTSVAWSRLLRLNMADHVQLSPHTIKDHLERIPNVPRVGSRAEIVAGAVRRGLIWEP
jgi:hypothetical protein